MIKMLDTSDREQVRKYLAMYKSLFPDWEREPSRVVMNRHRSGAYVTWLLYEGEVMLGFATLNVAAEQRYMILNFMGVDKNRQDGGLGTKMLEYLQHKWKWAPGVKYLVIEAEDRLKNYYLHRGIGLVEARYRIPKFTDDLGLVKMNLLVYTKKPRTSIPSEEMQAIVRHLLLYGYRMKKSDPRLKRCFDWDRDQYRIQPGAKGG
jgi:hypothetical protein